MDFHSFEHSSNARSLISCLGDDTRDMPHVLMGDAYTWQTLLEELPLECPTRVAGAFLLLASREDACLAMLAHTGSQWLSEA
jgi:hypothetical protein